MLALSLATAAHAISPLEADTMTARVRIENTVEFMPAGPQYRISEATGRLTWFPRDTWLQDVTNFQTIPSSRADDESVVFGWETPARTEKITVIADVATRNAVVPVRTRVPFPLEDVPSSYSQYLAPGEITDTSDDIQALAQELAAGSTDAYEVVYRLADWTTTNVEYSLESVGQPASKKATQVLATRTGKCDELTALFISMNRALGIPARFVAGYAYTNSPRFTNEWGGHGWAEVWLPGQGWIPFDVTYGEYGFLDAGHITLKTWHDAQETSIEYSATGRDFELRTRPLEISIEPTAMTSRTQTAIRLDLDTPHEAVGFGSAVLIRARVQNLRDYYVATRLDLAKTTSTDLLSSDYHNVLLGPRESKTIPFLVQISDDLERGYRYEFPFRLRSRLGEDATITINVRESAPRYDRSSYAPELASLQQKSQRAPDSPLTVLCSSVLGYLGDALEHECKVHSKTGAAPTSLVYVRCATACPSTPRAVEGAAGSQALALRAGEFHVQSTSDTAGVSTHTYAATDGTHVTTFYATATRHNAPTVTITLAAPETGTVSDAIQAVATVGTDTIVYNVTLRAHVQRTTSESQLAALERQHEMTFVIPGRALRPGDNTLTVTLDGVDALGSPVTSSATASIALEDVGIFTRIEFWLSDLGTAIGDLFQ
jgi:transglutaminase-like putative cysteine protease